VILSALVFAGFSETFAQDPDVPEQNYAGEVTLTYTTPQGQTGSLTRCGTSRVSMTDACQCATQLAIAAMPPGSSYTVSACGPPAGPFPVCQPCFGTLKSGQSLAAPGCSSWVVRIQGLTRRDGCCDRDRRRDCIVAVGTGRSYCEAVENACCNLRQAA